MQGGLFLLAEGFARLIGSGACRVAVVSLSGKESGGGPPRLLGEFSMGDAALVCGDWCWAGVALSVGYRGEGNERGSLGGIQ